MQEHDLTYVRAEMELAQKPPRGASGFAHWVQTNLFATIPDTILTVFGLLLTAVIVVPLVRWAFSMRSGPAPIAASAPPPRKAASSRTAGPAPAGLSSRPNSSSSWSAAILSTALACRS